MRKFTDEHRIPSVDISQDLRTPGFSNRPHDGHPSASANRAYADGLEPFLREVLAGTAGPDPTAGARAVK